MSGRRLVISSMVLENFKSYAGAQRVGPFHKSFSSVVGPNGSGKSNVIDAMLFVFGRRAKQLRFNKVSELIHNSTNFRNLDSAKVTVYFQGIIDRVTDKLKGLGIDLDNNRFLILQGEVEQISMMRPKAEDKNDTGLLEYLEDIIGTDKYVQPIEEASKGLEEVNDKRQSMIQRLKISEKEKDALEDKKTEAEMFLAKQADMLKDRIYANSIFIDGTQANLAKLERQAKEFESKLAYEREKFKAHDKEAKAAEKQFAGVEKEYKAKKLAAKLESDAAQAAERLEQLQQQLWKAEASLEGVLEGIKGEVEGYHQQLSQVRVELAPWEKRIGEVAGRISVVASERDVLAKKVKFASVCVRMCR
ncbi:RecF/RecN/SMC N terminal domain-containing protein [Dunaliella salina]|uniref:RecF/RecN/SMC N terminal domain-containing protein n=1 Tax=Dunaliella salina TaxID=3046 RepID=A0ABQ7GJW1_DUNSA|nr:RecF/RecN/SMC N terminal domain-containing protein [Dunaliella salina]|eukprot:KAF5834905.1 RecF/RecN/SMC N terminal domain-containing protein [Dunaliella salina]